MSFDNLGLVIMIALGNGVVFGAISGFLRKQKEKKEYEKMVQGARRATPRRR